jgi:hypothetical protein
MHPEYYFEYRQVCTTVCHLAPILMTAHFRIFRARSAAGARSHSSLRVCESPHLASFTLCPRVYTWPCAVGEGPPRSRQLPLAAAVGPDPQPQIEAERARVEETAFEWPGWCRLGKIMWRIGAVLADVRTVAIPRQDPPFHMRVGVPSASAQSTGRLGVCEDVSVLRTKAPPSPTQTKSVPTSISGCRQDPVS